MSHGGVSLFIENNLRVFSAAAVLAYQKHPVIRRQPVAPVAAGDLDLVPQIDVIILQQLYPLSVGEGIFQIDKEAIEQIEVLNRKIPDPNALNSEISSFLTHWNSASPPRLMHSAAMQFPPNG